MLALTTVILILAGVDVDIWTSPVWVPDSKIPAIVDLTITVEQGGFGFQPGMVSSGAFALSDENEKVMRLGEGGIAGKTVELPPGTTIHRKIDLGAVVGRLSPGHYQLRWRSGEARSYPVDLEVARAVKDVDFMSAPPETLEQYRALIWTPLGGMVLRCRPDIAPNHTRNFLDLCATGYYDGILFHRVIANFMIQGGCKLGTGGSNGPRMLKAEFNDIQHTRGTLSMARRDGDPDSASSQFFVVHADSLFLDGNYTAFGELIAGSETLDRIAFVPTGPGDRPLVDVPMVAVVLGPGS